MKKVLVIAYYYPPMGWSGVQRTVKFVRYLGDFGWAPVVLTVQKGYDEHLRDPTMLEEVKDAYWTERTRMITRDDVRQFGRMIGCLLWPFLKLVRKDPDWFSEGLSWRTTKHLYPDSSCGWIPFAVKSALGLIRRFRPAVIYATAPPWTDHIIGFILSKLTGIPFVPDFRDLWTRNSMRRFVSRWRDWTDCKLERLIVSHATKTICATSSFTEILSSQYPEVARNRFKTIYNGYDPEDIPQPTQRKGSHFRILHIGSLYGKQTPVHFLAAVRSLLAVRPSLTKDLRITFVGRIGQYEQAVSSPDLAPVVEMIGPVYHHEATRCLVNSDVLLLIVGEGCPEVMPGKIFEYIASPTHVLATVPTDGEAAKLLRDAGGATIVDCADVKGIREAIEHIYLQWQSGGLSGQRDMNVVKQYDRRELTRQLAKIFNECDRFPGSSVLL